MKRHAIALWVTSGLTIVGGLAVRAQTQSLPEEIVQAEIADEVSSDELLADEEMMLLGEGYSYEPGDRRDPFKSLLIVRERAALRGPRPQGIPGLLIDEIDLTGILITQDGSFAQVRSTEEDKSYLLREGDQLYDGDVVSIAGNELSFKQIVDDPTAVKPFREVVKKLNSGTP